MASQQIFNSVASIFSRLASIPGRVARFNYTQQAYDTRQIEGAAQYDFNNAQNIPLASDTDTNPTVLDKGLRAQGASISRGFQNHFIGRLSFNVNMVVDTFLSFITNFSLFIRTNINEYDPTASYFPGDRAFLSSFNKGQAQYTTYRRRSNVEPNGTIGVPPTDATRWEILRETSSLAQELPAQTNLRNIRQNGLYSASTVPIFATATDTPPGTTPQPFSLRVYGDRTHDAMTVQELFHKNTGMEYTRVIENNTVIIPWYKSKDPIGLNITGVNGLWAFTVENDGPLAGHLILHYGPTDARPVIWVDRNQMSPTFGHLIWRFKE